MPYEKLSELPASVKASLPEHGQEIFKSAYNSAWDEYKGPEDRRGNASREETARRVAWYAVKQEYEKNADGEWASKDGS